MVDFWLVEDKKVLVKDRKKYFLTFSDQEMANSSSVFHHANTGDYYYCSEFKSEDLIEDENSIDPMIIYKSIVTTDFPDEYYLDEPFLDNIQRGIRASTPTGLKIGDHLYISLFVEGILEEELHDLPVSYRYDLENRKAVVVFECLELELLIPELNLFKKDLTSRGVRYVAPTHYKGQAELLKYYLVGGKCVL